jgi:hypothetical protein
MSNKEYVSADYIGQRLRSGFDQIFRKATGSDFGLKYHFDHNGKEAIINFSIQGHDSEITINRNGQTSSYDVAHVIDGNKVFLYGGATAEGTVCGDYPEVKFARGTTGRIGDKEAKLVAKSLLENIASLNSE